MVNIIFFLQGKVAGLGGSISLIQELIGGLFLMKKRRGYCLLIECMETNGP